MTSIESIHAIEVIDDTKINSQQNAIGFDRGLGMVEGSQEYSIAPLNLPTFDLSL
jgi:hypothetical protein